MVAYPGWTTETHKAFAAKVFEAWKKAPLENVSRLGKQVMASTDWPADKRRPFNAISRTSLKPTYHELCRLVRECQAKIDAVPVEPVAPPMPEIIHVDRPVSPDPSVFMAAQPMSVLVLELVHRVSRQFDKMDEIAEAVQRLELQAASKVKQAGNSFAVPAPVPRAVPISRPAIPRIGVVGLLLDQFRFVQEKTKDRNCELVFMDKDRSVPAIPQSVTDVIVQRHVSHRWSEEAHNQFDSSHVHFVEGAQSGVVQKIYDITSRQ